MFFLNVALRKIGGDNRRLWGISRRKRIWGCGLIGLIFNWLYRNITLAFQRLRVHLGFISLMTPIPPLKIGLKIHDMTCFFTMLLSGFLWHISCKQTDRCFFQSVLIDVPFSQCWQMFLSIGADKCFFKQPDKCSFQSALMDISLQRSNPLWRKRPMNCQFVKVVNML